MPLEALFAWVDVHRERCVEALRALIRQPSVSAQDHGVKACAELLRSTMASMGIQARVEPTSGQPLVLGEVLGPPEAKTLLLYNHYDVQPADPEDAWTHAPFSAALDGDRIVGRGATDSKGNLMAQLMAVAAWRATAGTPPLHLKFLFDGEEEIGSPSLPDFVEAHPRWLAADGVVSFDGGLSASERPKLQLGSSGTLCVVLRVRGPRFDLHSAKARLVENPAWRLLWALNAIRSPDGRVRVPGFEDDVMPPTPTEQALLDAYPWDDVAEQDQLGVAAFRDGVRGPAALEKLLYEPTCNICGIEAGYNGAGFKAVLPAQASARVECRLVPNQDPQRFAQCLRTHLDREGFADVAFEVVAAVEPNRSPPTDPLVKALVSASRRCYGCEPVIKPRSEASGRQAPWLGQRLGVAGVATGIGPPFWSGHAPNEFMSIDHYLAGIKFAATVWAAFAGADLAPSVQNKEAS